MPPRSKKRATSAPKATDYRHIGTTRKNIPPAQIAAEGKVPAAQKVRYHYNPHLPPVLRFDPTGKTDRLPELLEEAGRRPLTEKEQALLAEALRNQQPWLEWAGKHEQHERGFFDVDPVALHIHERVSAQACIRAAMREDVQRDLFADPQQPYQEAVQFYKHDVDWANRLILGDSLQVMTSLGRREGLAGKVQMIYMDPPYGIKFASNFQPRVSQRDVKDRDQDATREPEMVRAYRDTWVLGTHSYLSYLRDRLRAAHELLADTGSMFVQIGDEHLHRVRNVLDDVFGPRHFVAQIAFLTTSGFDTTLLPSSTNHLLWFAKDIAKATYRQLYLPATRDPGTGGYGWLLMPTGEVRGIRSDELAGEVRLPVQARVYKPDNIKSTGQTATPQVFEYQGKTYAPGANNHWKTSVEGLARLGRAGRLHVAANSIQYIRFPEDFPVRAVSNTWMDTATGNFTGAKLYVVQTNLDVVTRCLLMTTDPGDLVLDPTCGSGTTAQAAEQWGRRWITIDTSRVAIAIARQRILTARLPYYALRPASAQDVARNPNGAWLRDGVDPAQERCTLRCECVPHITLKSIARNSALDAVLAKHEVILAVSLKELNAALKLVDGELRRKLEAKRAAKEKAEGKKAVGDVERRRWELPRTGWEHWTVPFDTDPDWPVPLQAALREYRSAWRAKMEEVNDCVAKNAEMEELVDRPEIVKNVVRVSGPFTVEGVRPEELSLGGDGLFDPTPNEFEESHVPSGRDNAGAYLAQMILHLRRDGLTFAGNRHKRFARLEALSENGASSLMHAEGTWEDVSGNPVAVSFGPQYGPVTAEQVEDVIRASKRYDELVIAGFSFDAEATAAIQQAQHPKLRVHQAYIRPDINPGMEGLLKDMPNSELFTVFGQPEVKVAKARDDRWTVTLEGVDIYDPVENTIRSTGAEKVAAWFLDSDFDGRCFCITQAFFPDQNAWDKIAKALGSAADAEAFEAFKGTKSLPFPSGMHRRIAVKVIDPRGNEVTAIRKLEA